jgi:hypothetical protein
MTISLAGNHRWHTDPVHSEDERERLRQTFDRAVELYDRVRPDYPEALFDDLIALTGLAAGDHLLEVGCATGKATRPLEQTVRRHWGAVLHVARRQEAAGHEHTDQCLHAGFSGSPGLLDLAEEFQVRGRISGLVQEQF